MKKSKLNKIELKDVNNTVIYTKLDPTEFMELWNTRRMRTYNSSSIASDYLNTIITA